MKKKLNERGLPSVGGVSPGDSSNNLGQARRPWNLTGSSGGHSQSADSGFSSKLGRVNKGRDDDKYAWQVRFPENEEEPEEDTYNMKLRSKISIDLRGRKPMPERKLTTDIDQLIEENEKFQIMLEDDRRSGLTRAAKNFFKGAGGDIVANAVGVIPGVDFGLIAVNMKQLDGDIERGRDILNKYTSSSAVSELQGDFYNDAVTVVDDISINLFDLLERAISILPAAGDVAGASASVVSVLSQAKNLFKVQKGAKKGLKIAAIKGVIRKARDLFSMILGSSESNAISSDVTFATVVPVSFDMLTHITNIIENYDAAYSKADDNYEDLTTEERQKVWSELVDANMLFTNPPGGFKQYVVEPEEIEEPSSAWSLFSEEKIRSLISQILSESEELIDEDLIEAEAANEVEEASGVGSIGGYAGPMASPANQEEFNKKMQKVSFPD